MAKQYYVSENINDGSFEDLETIYDATFEMNFRHYHMEKSGMPIISDGHMARGYPLEQPMMVVASTGSGKTRRLIIPFLISCICSSSSILAHDPKGELYKHTKKLLEFLGYKIIVFDLRNLNDGDRFNCCELAAKLYKEGFVDKADEIFQGMFNSFMASVRSDKEPFWHTTAATYLTGLAELCCDLFPAEKVTINNIYELHIQGAERIGSNTLLKTYFEIHKDKPYYKLIAPYINASFETRASLDAVLTSAISKFCRNESMVDQTTNSTFEISDLVEDRAAMFIISNDENSTVYSALVSAIVNEIYKVFSDAAEMKYNGRLPRRLSIVLDEFGNLAPIDDIDEKITMCRSKNIEWCLCCQSLNQLNLKYSDDVANTILGNCNIAYMYSNDLNLLKNISVLCGETTEEYTYESKPLFSVNKLRRLKKDAGQVLFLLSRMRPFVGSLADISEYNIVPLEKAEFPKRVPQVIEHINFQTIVISERKARENQQEFKDSLERRQPDIPSFEEFMAARAKERENKERKKSSKPTDKKTASKDAGTKNGSKTKSITEKDKTKDESSRGSVGRNVEEKNKNIQQLVDSQNMRPADMEEQKRQEELEQKMEQIKEDDKSLDINKDRKCSIVLNKVSSFDKTALIIGKCLRFGFEAGRVILLYAMERGNNTIENIPSDVASKMIDMLSEIGTIATKIDVTP